MSSVLRKLYQTSREHRPIKDINVTPMVDVMLVLLIIFMVAAPLLTTGISVDLPRAGGQNVTRNEKPLAVTINADGKIFVQDTEVNFESLRLRLEAIGSLGYDQRIYVLGDKNVTYGQVTDVMARISAVGFTHVVLVTDVLNDIGKNR